MDNTSHDTLLVGYARQELTSYNPSIGPSLAKVKASLLSLTCLKQMVIADLIGTKYDVYKAQRYRKDYKDLEERHRRQFAQRFVEEIISYTRKNATPTGIAHDMSLYLFADIAIYSDDLMEAILEKIGSSSETQRFLDGSKILRSVFLNDVLTLMLNIRKGNVLVDKNGQWKILNKRIVTEEDPGHKIIRLDKLFDENKLFFGLRLAVMVRKSWRADSQLIKKSLNDFQKSMRSIFKQL